MGDNLYCNGQKIVSTQFIDGWYRTFRGYPKMSQAVKDLLNDFLFDQEYGKVLMFFTGECGFDSDYSEFLLYELIEGRL